MTTPHTLRRSSLALFECACSALAWCDLEREHDRAEVAAAQRESLQAAFRHAFAGVGLPRFTRHDLRITHTALGRPRPRRSGPLAVWGRLQGLRAQDLHVSFSHDGGKLVTLVGWRPGLRGLGIDLVYLPRLEHPGKDRDYLHRLARRCMAEDEYRAFAATLRSDRMEDLRFRVAVAFALKEAASKALGTGLRLGLGLGSAASPTLRSLPVAWNEAAPTVAAVGDAAAALKRIRARHLVASASAVGDFVSAEVAAVG